MNNKNKRKSKNNDTNKKMYWIIGLLVLIICVGITIAYFSSRATSNEQIINTGNLKIVYENEQKFNITEKIDPIEESEIQEKATRIDFTITNDDTESNLKAYARIDIVDITLNKFKDYDFKWALYEGNTKITTGSFIAEEGESINLATNQELTVGDSRNYSVYVWINETGNDQSELMGGSFTGTVQVTGFVKQEDTLASKILSETTYDTPTFSTTSTDRGLFVQSGDSEKSEFGFPTYYYRGSATNSSINSTYIMNNYVSFGTYTSSGSYVYADSNYAGENTGNTSFSYTNGNPILWRIVRINEDGSIRLISENIISNHIAFDNTSPYTSNYNGSNIESVVNTWYNNNIGSNSGTTLDNLVQTGNFCNDISNNHNNVTLRIENKSPIFTCPNDGSIINAKAGIITVDEIMYAGALAGYDNAVTNNTTYLHNNSYFWTMSPSNITSNGLYNWSVNGFLGSDVSSTNSYMATRAVINLKPDVIVSEGNGSSISPYKIEG